MPKWIQNWKLITALAGVALWPYWNQWLLVYAALILCWNQYFELTLIHSVKIAMNWTHDALVFTSALCHLAWICNDLYVWEPKLKWSDSANLLSGSQIWNGRVALICSMFGSQSWNGRVALTFNTSRSHSFNDRVVLTCMKWSGSGNCICGPLG